MKISNLNPKHNDASSLKVEAEKVVIEVVKSSKIKNDVKKVTSKLVNRNVSQSSAKTIDESKMFAIYERRKMIEPVRKELIRRGWKKITVKNSQQIPRLVWLGRSNETGIEGSPIVNRLHQESSKNFCYKDILLNYRREINCKAKLNTPRTFKLFENEKNEFLNDYRFTAYSSFLRFLLSVGRKSFSLEGRINSKWIDYAVEELEAALSLNHHKQSEIRIESTENKSTNKEIIPNDFSKFKNIYQSVVKYGSKIKTNCEESTKCIRKCRSICDKIKKVYPNFEDDGFYNLWLLKPARRSLGFGIKIFDDDVDIFSYAKDNADMKYLVQKYVERLLLIYKTKFDLRQYFLVVHHATGVCLWTYKRSYLKFSTKLYDPLSSKVSVHITNTAIQCKYIIDKLRSTKIPQCNEWSSDRFLQYLKNEKKSHLWNEKIYPAMKENIITIVSASVDSSTVQPNHFQLYGCDFVIDNDYEPVLLEINGFPILTSVICSNCLKDLVKVIIDLKENPSADTGHFEMIWEKKLS